MSDDFIARVIAITDRPRSKRPSTRTMSFDEVLDVLFDGLTVVPCFIVACDTDPKLRITPDMEGPRCVLSHEDYNESVIVVHTKQDAIKLVMNLQEACTEPDARFYSREHTITPLGLGDRVGTWEFSVKPATPKTASPVLRQFLYEVGIRLLLVNAATEAEANRKATMFADPEEIRPLKFTEVE